MNTEQPDNTWPEQCVDDSHGEYVADLARWDHPDSNWNRAAMATPLADVFCARTEWQLSFHEARRGYCRVVARETPGSLVALAEQPDPNGGRVYYPLESGWLFGCPLLGPDAVELFGDLLAELAPRGSHPDTTFILSGLVRHSDLVRRLVLTFGEQFELRVFDETTLCTASLAGGLDGYLSRRSARQRRNLCKQARRATRAGVSFERHAPTNSADAANVYARMLAVEATSWKGIGDCGMTVDASSVYYDCMIRRLVRGGNARVMFARCDDTDIGFIFGGVAGHTYRGQQFSYAEDWRSYSIGNLLQLEQIQWLCEEQITRYDMGPLMDYKLHWTEEQRQILAVSMRRK